jgi:hypothetical protein
VADVVSVKLAAKLVQWACLKDPCCRRIGFGRQQKPEPQLILHADNDKA